MPDAAKLVLIIDDEADIRFYLAAALEDDGFRVVACGDEREAVAALNRERPDVIVLDILMPRRSGLSLYREFRARADLGDVPVILVSGAASAAELDEAGWRALAGEDAPPRPQAVLDKPVDVKRLVALARALTEARPA